ncbi:hypothetical protein CGRA01v4_02576 [Colletotrichum graminicola]|nr:hypothetical protein CGRA01v4_02576 [Colletotrichum graminicola]
MPFSAYPSPLFRAVVTLAKAKACFLCTSTGPAFLLGPLLAGSGFLGPLTGSL